MTRREFLKRSAPLVASGAVSLSFLDRIIHELFGPRRKYWDFKGLGIHREFDWWAPDLGGVETIWLMKNQEPVETLMAHYIYSDRVVKPYSPKLEECPLCELGVPLKEKRARVLLK